MTPTLLILLTLFTLLTFLTLITLLTLLTAFPGGYRSEHSSEEASNVSGISRGRHRRLV